MELNDRNRVNPLECTGDATHKIKANVAYLSVQKIKSIQYRPI